MNHSQITINRMRPIVLAASLFLVSIVSQAKTPPPLFDSLSTKQLWLTAQVLPGSGQIINKQYWKLPIIYGGIGGFMYKGFEANKLYQDYKYLVKNLDSYYSAEEINYYKELKIKARQSRNLYYAGATAIYVASVADALLVHNKGEHSPATATIFSLLVPGMGQVYNQKYWKVPIIYGGISTLYYLVDFNHRGYRRFQKAYIYSTDNDPNTVDEFNGERSADDLKYFKDQYRRNRDLSFLGLTFFYVLNVIDANVDAHLYDWNVDDDLALRIEPLFEGGAWAGQPTTAPTFGVSCKLNF